MKYAKALDSIKLVSRIEQSSPVLVPEDVDRYIYTPKAKITTELALRKKDQILKKLESDDSIYSPISFIKKNSRPTAVLFRQLATPTHEILRFFKLAESLSLKPIILEYLEDKFVGAGNPYKRTLGKLPIFQHTGSDGRDIVEYRNILDFNGANGKPLHSLVCKSGEPLVDFHHNLFSRILKKNVKKFVIDGSDWFMSGTHGEHKAHEYYDRFFRLFISNAVLFDNFGDTEAEDAFLRDTVWPAFHRVTCYYGVRPLIVRLLPDIEEKRQFWDSYPNKVSRILNSQKE